MREGVSTRPTKRGFPPSIDRGWSGLAPREPERDRQHREPDEERARRAERRAREDGWRRWRRLEADLEERDRVGATPLGGSSPRVYSLGRVTPTEVSRLLAAAGIATHVIPIESSGAHRSVAPGSGSSAGTQRPREQNIASSQRMSDGTSAVTDPAGSPAISWDVRVTGNTRSRFAVM
jgi:hypothetical protein